MQTKYFWLIGGCVSLCNVLTCLANHDTALAICWMPSSLFGFLNFFTEKHLSQFNLRTAILSYINLILAVLGLIVTINKVLF